MRSFQKRRIVRAAVVSASALLIFDPVSAQADVTLYGEVDAVVRRLSFRPAVGATINRGLLVDSGGLSGSRWGIRGTEDLGGGMSANFLLESGFRVDTGGNEPSNLQFHRQAWVGLRGDSWGQIRAGHQYGPYTIAFAVLDGQSYYGSSVMGLAWNGIALLGQTAPAHADGGPGAPARTDNSLAYYSPTTGGFTAHVLYAPGENATVALPASRITGLRLSYVMRPLEVHFGQENLKPQNGATSRGRILGSSYDFGVVRAYAAYGDGTLGPVSDRKWSLGAAIPIGGSTLQLGYAVTQTRAAPGAPRSDTHGLGAIFIYRLSKRTNLYAQYSDINGHAAGTSLTANTNIVGLGMRHNF